MRVNTRLVLSLVAFCLAASLGCSSSNGAPGAGAGGSGGAGNGTGGTVAPGSGSGGISGTGGAGTGGAPAATGGATGSGGAPVDAATGSGGATATDASTVDSGGNTGVLGDGTMCSYTDDKQFCACLNATCGGDTLNDQTKMARSIYCGQCTGTATCIGRASAAGGAIGICEMLKGLTSGQKQKAAGLTSIWENSTPTLQYGFSSDIGDGRGYTSGRAGFCTGTGDAIIVVQCYAAAKPGNPLAKFIPELIRLEQKFVASNGDLQGDTSGLQGYTTAWMSSGNDAIFRSCQDSAVDAIYYGAALKKATDKKFTKALTTVSLWDGQIMHGESDPNFGMLAMMAKADTMVTLSDPPTAQQESDWLGAFHKIRAQVMTTRDEWVGNIYRVATYEQLRKAGNMDFTGCVQTGGVSASTYWPGLPNDRSPSFNVCGD
ncbi:MAG TPA: chitosanase [Polyangia bacterium]|jgi:chitosanase|nr:chitosanase [Polyangia bacterium]